MTTARKFQPSTVVSLRARRTALLLSLALLAALLAHLLGGAPSAEAAGELPTRCARFQTLALGSAYGVGAVFMDNVVSMQTYPFQWDNGVWTNGGVAVVDNLGLANGSPTQELNPNNINVRFGLGGLPASEIRFRFGDYGGNENILINNDFRNVQDLIALNGAVVGGVNVTVVYLTADTGIVRLWGGAINGFMVGGQEFFLDDVCIIR